MASDKSLGPMATRIATEGDRQRVRSHKGSSEPMDQARQRRRRYIPAQGLRRKIAKGAKPRLCASDRAKLPALLAWGAEAFGFSGNVWNSRRVSKVIKQVFGVSYHPDHCGRLLHEMGWSQQKPLERAAQRNEEAIQDWREQQWPALKKSRAREADHHLCRRSRFLLASDGGAHLRTARPNTDITSHVDARSSFCDWRHHRARAPLHADTRASLSSRRCRRVFAFAVAQNFGEAAGHLGRFPHSPRKSDQNISCFRGSEAIAPRTPPRLRS